MALIRSVRDTESVNEDLKASIERCLHSFINNKDTAELNFMSSFTAPERSYVHYLAKSLKLMSKSRGKGMNRAVTVYKCERSSIIHRDATFHLTTLSHKVITTLMTQAPLTSKEKLDITPHSERDRTSAPDNIQREPNRCVNRLVTGVPIVPTIRRPPADQAQSTNAHRHQLPIHALRESIIQTINDNPVVVISGETGSGKTTQVPQYIMEYHERVGRACRIICSQPRRIAAVAMGERVAFERNCKVGTEVGYQIRHESVTNSRTILTYITNGILLRTLMCGDSSLATVTHLIMDEIHVRDRVADFILVAVREALAKYRSLRLVLISASVDTASFSKYFNNCPVITVPGRLYEVKEYFLEDILKLTDYKTKEMEKYRNESKKRSQQDQEAKEWMIQAKENKSGLSPTANSQGKSKSQEKGVDFYLENATRLGCQESLKQIVHLIKNNEASVDHQHPSTRVTPLIAACIHGHIEIVEQLLNLGASLHLAINRNQTAIEFAREFGHQNIVDILTLYSFVYFAKGSNDSHKPSAIPDDKYVLLESYKYCFKETIVNPDLILAIVNKIQTSNQMGAVLIFLPGYEEIVMMLEKLSKREPKPNECLLKLVALHSKMDTCDQKIVFQPAPMGMRKIILSTNIAESCITLQDVVFVVDTGLVRECCQSLRVRTVRCSQWCVRQRRARAGRLQPGGHCYHLFSAADYHAMPAYPTPQILRTPLQNLCLQTKLLAQGNIADFIAKTLDPPSFTVVRTAVQLLKTIDALDPCEEVTLLGQHLIDLPLAPHLGKALIYAVLLKCLDPVLTIVAMLSYDDPFLTPDQPSQRREAQVMRRKMADRSQSDHCLLLQVFMKWLAARNQGHGRLYCQKNYLCEARLEMVHSHRAQLLTQLRSSGFVRAKDMGSDVRDLNQNSEKLSVVKAALTGGLYPNLVRVDRELNSLRTHDLAKVTLHPSSVLRGSNGLQKNVASTLATDWIVYDEVISAGNTSQVRVCSLVTDVTVAIFAGPSRYSTEQFIDPDAADRGSDSEEEEVLDKRTAAFKVDEWAVFRVQPHIARLIIMLRNKWHAVLAKRLRTPYKPPLPNDEAVIEALVAVLCSEEEEVGLQQPTGIGAKPLLINNQENDFSPLRRRSNNDISKQLSSALDISGNRHPNHRRTYDMNDNASNSTVGTSSSNSCSLSPSLSQGSSSQLEQATAGNRAFFIIRYGNTRSFERACSTNVWHFQSNTEMRLKNAYREGKTVILIISLQGSSHFQGYARLKSDHCEWNDVIFDQSAHSMSPSMGGAVPLPIEWLKIGNIQANSLRHFCGNDFNRLLTYRDGHEIDSNMGEALCLLWEAQVPHNPPLGHHVFHQTPGNGHGRPIRAPPQQQYYGNNSYGPPHGGPNGSHNMRQNM